MTQKRRKVNSGKAIGETTALRWEPTHITKPNPRVVPLQTRSMTELVSRGLSANLVGPGFEEGDSSRPRLSTIVMRLSV